MTQTFNELYLLGSWYSNLIVYLGDLNYKTLREKSNIKEKRREIIIFIYALAIMFVYVEPLFF